MSTWYRTYKLRQIPPKIPYLKLENEHCLWLTSLENKPRALSPLFMEKWSCFYGIKFMVYLIVPPTQTGYTKQHVPFVYVWPKFSKILSKIQRFECKWHISTRGSRNTFIFKAFSSFNSLPLGLGSKDAAKKFAKRLLLFKFICGGHEAGLQKSKVLTDVLKDILKCLHKNCKICQSAGLAAVAKCALGNLWSI